jgi:hypothetical protein
MHVGQRLLLLVLAASALAGRAHAKELRIAVLEIRALGTEAAKAELLSEVALTEAAGMGGFDVVGKSDIASVMGFEKQKQVMGCAEDSSCLAEIGGALGVDLILVGSLGTLGDLFRLDLKLVDTKKAKVRARVGVTVEGKEGQLVAAVQKAIRDLLGPLKLSEQQAGSKPPPGETARREQSTAMTAPVAKGSEPAPAASATSSRRRWAWISGGTGLALLAGGAIAGLQARSAFDDEKAASLAGDLKAYEDNKSKARSMSIVADGLFIAGAAGAGIGAWLWFTSQPSTAVAIQVLPLPGGALATVSGGF